MTTSGSNRLVEMIERTPLAWPMALLVAAATAFLAYAVPAEIVERAVTATGVGPLITRAVPFGPAARAVLALALALGAGGATWLLFHWLERDRRPAAADDAEPLIDLFAPEEPVAPAPQLRRADVHPDAPPRRPIFAASDLGAPMDDVDTGRTPFGRAPLFVDESVQEPAEAGDADTLILDERYGLQADTPAPVAAVSAAPVSVATAVEPDESISGLMARLERGLERRGGAAAGAPDDADGGLRQALDELRRMTTGR